MIKWAIEQVEGAQTSITTPIGRTPAPGAIDIAGLGLSEDSMQEVSAVNIEEWRQEVPLIEEWFAKIGSKLPHELQAEFANLQAALK